MKNRIFMRGWLQGFFDGEGCVSFLRKEDGRKQTSCRIYVGNTDAALTETCRKYLTALGIEYSFRVRKAYPPRKPLSLIYISRHAELVKFARIVGFASVTKTKTMTDILNYIKTRGPKYSKELMRDLYINKKMSLPDICRHFGKHSKQQWYFSNLLRSYGIPTRSRSKAIKIALSKAA